MFAGKLTGFLLPFLFGWEAWGQEPAFPPPPEAPAPAPVAAEADTAATPAAAGTSAEFRPGFEGGLRLGLGLPIGKAGQGADGVERELSDLTEWRAPFWVDIAYRVSPA